MTQTDSDSKFGETDADWFRPDRATLVVRPTRPLMVWIQPPKHCATLPTDRPVPLRMTFDRADLAPKI